MIDFRTFSMNRTEVTVERYTSTLTAGVYQKTLSSTLTFWASVQPYDTVDPASIYEPEAGSHVEEKLWMYCSELVYSDDSASDNPTADIVIVDEVSFKVKRVQKWLHLSIPYYKALLVRFDGD